MKHLNLKSIRFLSGVLLLSLLNQCSKEEVVKVITHSSSITATPRDSLFVGVHLKPVPLSTTVKDLIIGFTYSDSSFRQTDSVRGTFNITSLYQLISCYDSKNHLLYFFYIDDPNNTPKLLVGVVDGITGKYIKSLEILPKITGYCFIQCIDGDLYFSTGQNVYSVNITTGNLTLEEINPSINSQGWWFSNSHAITKKHFYYVKYNEYISAGINYIEAKLMIKDRISGLTDSLNLPGNYCSYRSLIYEPNSNCLYTYNTNTSLTGVETFKISKIDLNTKTITGTSLDRADLDNSGRGACYQPQFHPKKNVYSYKFFENIKTFQIIDMTNGKFKNYPTPSYLGQCIFE